jgi:hypothetical protein
MEGGKIYPNGVNYSAKAFFVILKKSTSLDINLLQLQIQYFEASDLQIICPSAALNIHLSKMFQS